MVVRRQIVRSEKDSNFSMALPLVSGLAKSLVFVDEKPGRTADE